MGQWPLGMVQPASRPCLFKSSRKLGSEIRSRPASVIKVGRRPEGREVRLLRGDAQASVAGQAAPHASCGEHGEEIPSVKALELGLPQVPHT